MAQEINPQGITIAGIGLPSNCYMPTQKWFQQIAQECNVTLSAEMAVAVSACCYIDIANGYSNTHRNHADSMYNGAIVFPES